MIRLEKCKKAHNLKRNYDATKTRGFIPVGPTYQQEHLIYQ